MRIEDKITDFKFLNIKKVEDPDNNVQGYFFAERLGKDSVAFICYDPNTHEFLLNKEYKPPIDDFLLGAFGGSMDKDKKPEEIVIDEVKEEAGFRVSKRDVQYLGKAFVSTQMNQFCHLFLVFVDKDNQEEREPENAVEAMASTEWVSDSKVWELEDWKAITILGKSELR